MYNDFRRERMVLEQERKLRREVDATKGFQRFKKMLLLGALTREYRR